ncbi:MAG: ATP-binding protein [Bacteroidales bacterium]
MEFKNLSKNELVEEIKKAHRELRESQDMLQAIRTGEIDAVVVQREGGEQIYVLDDANITYRRMIEEMNEGAVIFNPGGSVLFCNKAFAAMVKFPVEEIVSKPITNFFNPKLIERFRELSANALRKPVRESIKLRPKTGKNIPAIISLHLITTSSLDTFLMTVTDERERLYIKKLSHQQAALKKLTLKYKEAKEETDKAVKLLKEKNFDYALLNREYVTINNKLAKANKELLTAKKRAEKSDHLKSAFIANMSHEIRTPLNSIMGYTKILANLVTDDEHKKHIEIISLSGKNLLHLIDSIVDLSRLEVEEMKIEKSIVFLNDLMDGIKAQFEPFTVNKEGRPLELRLLLPEETKDQPVIYADEFRLQQIISNLLSNAFKNTDEGYIEFGYKMKTREEKVMFFVKDTGTGICKGDQKIIFNRFQHGTNSSKKVVSGTGLGLAISKGLTALMGGEIWLESEEGSGSTFYFTIALDKINPESRQKPVKRYISYTDIPRLGGKKLLLSEDDLFSREMMVYLLKKTGAELITATDGKETLKMYKQHGADLVLLDIRLPEVDGYQVLKEIRSGDPDTIVIAQTAYAMLDEIRKFKLAGFNDYLIKPVSDDQLYALLHKYLC